MKTKLKQALDKSKPIRMQVGDWFLGSHIGSFILGVLLTTLGILVVILAVVMLSNITFLGFALGVFGVVAYLLGAAIRDEYRKSTMWRHRNSQWYKNMYGQK